MILQSKTLRSLNLKGSGNYITAQTSNTPSVTVLKVDSAFTVTGELSSTTMKGQELLTSEVRSSPGVNAIDLNTDLTVFNNGAAASGILAAGVDGQVKYLSKATAGNAVAVTSTYASGITTLTLSSEDSGATLVYNTALGFWVVVNGTDIILA